MSPSNSCGRPCACSKEKNITIQAEEGSSKEINRLSIPISKDWKRAPNAEDQFASYHDDDGNKTVLDEENPDKDPWIYSGNRLRALQFPLGGFGTGQINFQGDGTLQGWTIQNQFHDPEYAPLNKLPGNLFGIKADNQAFVLQTPQNYSASCQFQNMGEESHVTAYQMQRLQKLPGIRSLQAKCQYPIATVKYDIAGFPLQVQLQAMTPLIPGNAKDSSFPLAIFEFSVTNPGTNPVCVSLMQSTLNFVGWDGKLNCCHVNSTKKESMLTNNDWESNVNLPIHGDNYGGWNMIRQNDTNLDPTRKGSLALVANVAVDSSTRVGLLVSDSSNDEQENEIWNQFVEKDNYPSPCNVPATHPSAKGHTYVGAVTQTLTVAPGGTERCRFVLAWYFPNRPSYAPRPNLPNPLGNNYQNWFTSAQNVVEKFLPRADALMDTTRLYVKTMYSSSIPWEFLESAAGRLACMRSPTMFWSKDGTVLGNEGNGCCPLNCTHVYGYTTLLERLYPELAKGMLHSNFIRNFDPQKGCSMRFGNGGFAIDGSLACVIKTFLVVQQADSNFEFLSQVWPAVKQQIEIVFKNFDVDRDGVIRCAQQNTYDTAMYGANTFIGSYWVTALKATAIMASWMKEIDFSEKCKARAELAAANYERICWKEDFGYYIADVDETNCKHSYGPGCFIDQLCAVGLSLACGLGTIFDPVHEAAARQAILDRNIVSKPPFQDLQKHFYDGDCGIRCCTYPYGKLPGCYVYDDLVSIGFTYPVIAAMIHEGNLKSASIIAKNLRARHSGINRSPWNEPECGLLYSRAMASWNLFDQACGFSYDSSTASIGYAPKMNATKFSCFLTVESGWGQFQQNGLEGLPSGSVTLRALHGSIVVKSLKLKSCATKVHARHDTFDLSASISIDGIITFDCRVCIQAGSTVTIVLFSDDVKSPVIKKNSGTGITRLGTMYGTALVAYALVCIVGLLFALAAASRFPRFN